jgi:hypothetical protein
MKKILILLLAIPSLAFGQETRSQAASSLVQLGMSPELSTEVAGLSTGLGVFNNNTPLKWDSSPTGTPVSALNVNFAEQTVLNTGSNAIVFQNQGTDEAYLFNNKLAFVDSSIVGQNTSDAADNEYSALAGGGDAGISRGSYVQVYGNEEATGLGRLDLRGGNVATGNVNAIIGNASAEVRVLNSSGNELWTFDNSGNLKNGDASLGGSILFGTTGSTISIQEGTPASACMGAATPNGNTPVAVSTTCATTGSRVFYTRAGAVTNMGTVSTTTAPSGTGFSFASTGASDTLASSVIWFIVKEAA